MIPPVAYLWKRTPFLRLLPGLIMGILLEWHLQVGMNVWITVLALSCTGLLTYSIIPHFTRFSAPAISGITTAFLFTSIGGILAFQHDIRNSKRWIGRHTEGTALQLRLIAPLAEKENSWRGDAVVTRAFSKDTVLDVDGRVIIYFSKDDLPRGMEYGSQLLIKKPVQEIKGPSNPGAFNFRTYCLFHSITHQVFLRENDFVLLPQKKKSALKNFIFTTKNQILEILRRYIPGEKEAGLAEALLLGYKNDLDKSLVQSYTNTGVVHIIAVSGLHLGLIYALLGILLKPLRKRRQTGWVGALLIIAGLWLFSLLAGAQASVLRSALMFTCIVIGENLGRKTSVFNTMGVSAFILICIDPFIIWDVGFQLSYAAVASIVIFMQPVYNWFYFKNPLVDLAWKMNAVTIAAQILTVPLTLFHFNQFPALFLITNFIAVPLSSAILLGEIFLCSVSFIPGIASLTGKCITWMIRQMNSYIERIESMPFALLENISVSLAGAIILFMVIGALCWWLMGRSMKGLKLALALTLLFIIDDGTRFLKSARQKKLVVYHVPKKTAIDIVIGRSYWFSGDGSLVNDPLARQYHLKPSRIHFRVHPSRDQLPLFPLDDYNDLFQKRVLIYHSGMRFRSDNSSRSLDVLLVTGNQAPAIKDVSGMFRVGKVVLDGSVPIRRAAAWKRECYKWQIPVHDVTTDGAFVMNL